MSNERDELARLVAKTHRALTPYEVTDAILAAGYRKPRIITTPEEVYEMTEGSVLLDSAGDVAQIRHGLWCSYETSAMTPRRMAKYIPATVLHEGDSK